MIRHITAVAFALLASSALAETITVCAKGCDFTSINAAIAAASDGDVIQLAAETYFEGEQIDTLGKAITLRGALGKDGQPSSALDGAGTHLVLICQSGETDATVFENLVIQHGTGGSIGEGVSIQESSPTLTNCILSKNSGPGGAIVVSSGSHPILHGCSFFENSGFFAGGMLISGGEASLFDCTFSANTSVPGGWSGAIGFLASKGTLVRCHFLENTAGGGWVGAVFASSSELAVAECVFSGNSGAIAGSIYASESSTAELENCTFTECCQIVPPRSIIDLGGNDYDSWCDDCRANIDCRNDAVDAEDLGYLLARWGTNDPQSDIDGDGLVTASDLGFLFADWGPCQ